MTITDHLIADYLKRNGFNDTLKQFEKQSGINSNTKTLHYEKLEDIVNDRISYLEHQDNILKVNADTSTNNTVENSHLFNKWSEIVPKKFRKLDISNSPLIVHISTSRFIIDDLVKDVLFVTSSDKKLTLIDLSNGDVITSYTGLHGSVGKCCYAIPNSNRVLSCGMDGKIILFELVSRDEFKLISEQQIHKRLVTDFKIFQQDGTLYIFSIGWDFQLKVTTLSSLDKFEIVSSYKLLSNATAIELGTFDNLPVILLTRIDSTQLAYFTLLQEKLIEIVKISLNDAEFSTHGFTPMTISLSRPELEVSDTFIAIGTSHVPYLRLIITRVPDLKDLISKVDLTTVESIQEQQLSTPVLRGFILGNFNSLSPQDKYSQAKILWRSDNSGIWISGDDGVIRGIEFKNGEIIETLQDGHDQRIKCLLNYKLGEKEILISSGIDRKLIYWY